VPDIHYVGHSCFRLRGRDGTIICDPYSRSIGLDLGRPTAHIVTISHDHPAHNNVAAVRPLRESIFLIDGPGEYEVRGVLVKGVRTQRKPEPDAEPAEPAESTAADAPAAADTPDASRFNTAYVIYLDEIAFCHLGNLGHELTQSQLEELGNIDVLFVPVGGGPTLTPAEAASVISQIEPRLVVPMHYAAATAQLSFDQPLLPLEKFAHEIGLKDTTPQDKLSITLTNLPAEGEETRIVVMAAANS
jgi:L-ascorbate metabolism protein UlaG (beta-lactamase superfamily)